MGKSNFLEKKKDFLEELYAKSTKELQAMPKETLWSEKRRGKVEYYCVSGTKDHKKRQAINKRPEKIAQLARKSYLESQCEIIEANLTVINKICQMYEQRYIEPTVENVLEYMAGKRNHAAYIKVYRAYDENLKTGTEDGEANGLISANWRKTESQHGSRDEYASGDPHMPSSKIHLQNSRISVAVNETEIRECIDLKRYSAEVIAWAIEEYTRSTYLEDDLKHRTSRGLWTRSKSESLIAERLYAHKIPFRYEQVLETEFGIMIPDFIIPAADGTFYYLEHAGMPQVDEYWKRHKEKIDKYEKLGIVPWKNLIVTYDNEEGGIDLATIESEICNKLL